MAYRPVGDAASSNSQSTPLQDIELNTQYDAGTYNYTPPAGPPPERTSKDTEKHVDSKAAFTSSDVPVDHWPVRSQKPAAFTPLRMALFVFDLLLASMPIMFIGELSWTTSNALYCAISVCFASLGPSAVAEAHQLDIETCTSYTSSSSFERTKC